MPDNVEAVLAAYASDQIDLDNVGQYEGFLSQTLLLNRCDECSNWHQPPQPICPRCWSEAVRPTAVSGEGTVYMAMQLHQGPGIEPGKPLPVVVVELPEQEGLRFTAAMVDGAPGDVAVGRAVELTWTEKDGAPWPAFRPTDDA